MDWAILKLKEERGNTNTGHKLVLGLLFREPQSLQLQGLGLEKADQGEQDTAQTCTNINLHIYLNWATRGTWGFSLQIRVRVKVRFQRTPKPAFPGTLGLEKVCHGEHGTGPTFISPHLSLLGHPRNISVCPKLPLEFRVQMQGGTHLSSKGCIFIV